MIRIGMDKKQKKEVIIDYIKTHSVKSIVVFSHEYFPLGLNGEECQIPVREYFYRNNQNTNDIILYRIFYPLLEEIGKDHLIVINECMRNGNRSGNLTYNCLHKYLNQCGHQIIFEFLPFISEPKDFSILLDFDTKEQFKGTSFQPYMLEASDVQAVQRDFVLNIEQVNLPSNSEEEYINKKQQLFDSIGSRDPDIIPRELHVFTGKWKRCYIDPGKKYVSRNARFHRENIVTYQYVELGVSYTLIDFQHSRLQMNDFLRRTRQNDLLYLSTGLSIDNYYINEFNQWAEKVCEFYAQTGICAYDS